MTLRAKNKPPIFTLFLTLIRLREYEALPPETLSRTLFFYALAFSQCSYAHGFCIVNLVQATSLADLQYRALFAAWLLRLGPKLLRC